jgi:hypothetical protein
VEVPNIAWKEDLPSVSAEEPTIAEAAMEEKDIRETPDEFPTVNDAPDVSLRELPVEEEHSQEADNHVEISGE